jgi:hypothetical protein
VFTTHDSQWKKENGPPVVGPTRKGVSTQDFCSTSWNAEEHFSSTVISHKDVSQQISGTNWKSLMRLSELTVSQQDSLPLPLQSVTSVAGKIYSAIVKIYQFCCVLSLFFGCSQPKVAKMLTLIFLRLSVRT